MYIETVLKNHHWELFCAFNLEYHIYTFIKSPPKQKYSIKFYHKQYGCNSFKTMWPHLSNPKSMYKYTNPCSTKKVDFSYKTKPSKNKLKR